MCLMSTVVTPSFAAMTNEAGQNGQHMEVGHFAQPPYGLDENYKALSTKSLKNGAKV